MLELSELTASYGRLQVLHGLSLRIGRGRVHALLGRNGAGKSTALRRIMGLLPPSQGQIRLDGQDIADWPTHRIARAGIGYVPEGHEVFTTLSVRENLTLAGRIGRGGWNLDAVSAVFPNLAGRMEAPAAALSGGEQQMLAIGRALMTSPRVMLLDEPSQGLSVAMIAGLRDALARLKAQGMTILLVEQNVGFTTALADDVTLISRGVAVWTGDVAAFATATAPRRRWLGGDAAPSAQQ